MRVEDCLAFRAALTDPGLGRILEVTPYDLASAIEGIDRPCFVVSCHTGRLRTVCQQMPKFVLILHNSYVLSFADNLAGALLYHRHRKPLDLSPFTTGFAKKLVAEQLLQLGTGSMARVLFLETVLAYEPSWRVPLQARETDEPLRRSSAELSRITADFLLHHEIGHAAAKDRRFDLFVRELVDDAISSLEPIELDDRRRAILREEMEADVFGLNCCLTRYASRLSEVRLKEYLDFASRAVIALNVLYACADDLYRINVDPTRGGVEIDVAFEMARCRLAIMAAHIEHFSFGGDTVEALPIDDYLPLGDVDELFEALWLGGARLTDFPSEDLRRAAEVIDMGFAPGAGFDAVIDGYRSWWILGADDTAPAAPLGR